MCGSMWDYGRYNAERLWMQLIGISLYNKHTLIIPQINKEVYFPSMLLSLGWGPQVIYRLEDKKDVVFSLQVGQTLWADCAAPAMQESCRAQCREQQWKQPPEPHGWLAGGRQEWQWPHRRWTHWRRQILWPGWCGSCPVHQFGWKLLECDDCTCRQW